MTKFVMERKLDQILREKRQSLDLRLKEISHLTGIDQALISKYESGNRYPSEKHIEILERKLQFDNGELKKHWLTDKIVSLLSLEKNAKEILVLAESRIDYLTKGESTHPKDISDSLKDKLNKVVTLKNDWKESKPLNPTQLSKMKDYFSIAYTFESNRIEGNTLTLQETQLIVNEGLTIGGKTMNEHLEAINHSEAVEYLSKLIKKREYLSKRILLELHYLVLKGIDKDNAGKYRTVPVTISGSRHVPPQPYLIDSLMDKYFQYYEEQKITLHPVLLAAEMSERLVTIHPFIDGNGRTSRLIMNLILLRYGYTIANLKGNPSDKINYYKALEAAQIDNDSEAYYELIVDTSIKSLQEHLDLV